MLNGSFSNWIKKHFRLWVAIEGVWSLGKVASTSNLYLKFSPALVAGYSILPIAIGRTTAK
jgi:hypothetical protein